MNISSIQNVKFTGDVKNNKTKTKNVLVTSSVLVGSASLGATTGYLKFLAVDNKQINNELRLAQDKFSKEVEKNVEVIKELYKQKHNIEANEETIAIFREHEESGFGRSNKKIINDIIPQMRKRFKMNNIRNTAGVGLSIGIIALVVKAILKNKKHINPNIQTTETNIQTKQNSFFLTKNQTQNLLEKGQSRSNISFTGIIDDLIRLDFEKSVINEFKEIISGKDITESERKLADYIASFKLVLTPYNWSKAKVSFC